MDMKDIKKYDKKYVYLCQQTPTKDYYFIGEVKDVNESSMSLVRVKPLEEPLKSFESPNGSLLEQELVRLDSGIGTEITLAPLETIIQIAPLSFTVQTESGMKIHR